MAYNYSIIQWNEKPLSGIILFDWFDKYFKSLINTFDEKYL